MNPESSSAPTRARLGSSPDGWAHKILSDLDGSRCLQMDHCRGASGEAGELLSRRQGVFRLFRPRCSPFPGTPPLKGRCHCVPQCPRPTRIKYQTTRRNSDVDSIDRGCEPPCKWEYPQDKPVIGTLEWLRVLPCQVGRDGGAAAPPSLAEKKRVVSVKVTCSLVPSLDLVWAACDMQLLPVAGDNNAWCMQVVGYFVRDDRRPPTRQTDRDRQSGPQEDDALIRAPTNFSSRRGAGAGKDRERKGP